MVSATISSIQEHINAMPHKPGVYFFKDAQGTIVYIGKAKDLKKRTTQYLQRQGLDLKADSLLAVSVAVEYQVTDNEIQALLLEAKLIQSYQPQFNVLLKHGQPFIYICATQGKIPELILVRNQKRKGTYVGPFIESGAARKAHEFVVKTFRLKLCKKKIENGCLNYHLGICAGSCRSDFDLDAYRQRLELALEALKNEPRVFVDYVKQKIEEHNARLEFEQSRQLHSYCQAFEKLSSSLLCPFANIDDAARKDIWIFTEDGHHLYVFQERDTVVKRKRIFYFPISVLGQEEQQEVLFEHMVSFYRSYKPPAMILASCPLGQDVAIYEAFLKEWHALPYNVTLLNPADGHFAAIVRLATIQAQQEIERRSTLSKALKLMLKTPMLVETIDCFDISHKQGMYMVGSCVRFTNGQPDKSFMRHFHIKTVEHQNDYAALQEIVMRRYRSEQDMPDIIMIDGGKGQLHAIQECLPNVEIISLAKREETIFSARLANTGKKLDQKHYASQVLIALRDYAHHVAISFHRSVEGRSLVPK